MTSEYIRSLTRLRTDGRISKLREALKDRRNPVCEDEVLNYLLMTVRALAPAEIEADEDRYLKAKENFAALGLSSRARCVFGDAADVLPALDGPFGLIFLDGPKAQYVHYLPDLKRLLREGGVLIADDVLLYGWVDGREPAPKKRHSLVERIREYLVAVAEDETLITSVLDIGEGVAVSVKKRGCELRK